MLRKAFTTNPLQKGWRVNSYAIGAGEALLLDQIAPDWHERYLDPRMDLRLYFRV
ncbi:MAG TPA: hypothetical protein VJP85_10045 [Candidatus Baltobacteraceae bacterium]|nr:hypothetical protein [Candidatus Baltobacteraceae bacterium]